MAAAGAHRSIDIKKDEIQHGNLLGNEGVFAIIDLTDLMLMGILMMQGQTSGKMHFEPTFIWRNKHAQSFIFFL